MISKKIVLPILSFSLIGVTLFGTTNVLAHDTMGVKHTIVQKLAARFGVSENEVQAVFDEVRTHHMQKIKEAYEKKLSEDVVAGKLTQDQKQLILKKQEELRLDHEKMHEELRSLTSDQRQGRMEAKRKELEDWAIQNEIDPSYLRFTVKIHARGGFDMDQLERVQ